VSSRKRKQDRKGKDRISERKKSDGGLSSGGAEERGREKEGGYTHIWGTGRMRGGSWFSKGEGDVKQEGG